MNKLKFAAGVFMVTGTSVGTGMLGLPIAVAGAGFWPTVICFLASWIFMLFASFYLLEAKLAHPHGTDLLGIMQSVLNKPGQVFGTICYLLLLYALICTYLLSGTAWLDKVLEYSFGIRLANPLSFMFIVVSAYVLLQREQFIYKTNRLLGFILLLVFFALVFGNLTPENTAFLADFKPRFLYPYVPIITTAFGFNIIIPALTDYLEYDRINIKRVVIVGSTASFLIYILWIWAILGTLPQAGLALLQQEGDSGTGVLLLLAENSQLPYINFFTMLFAFLAVSTSFIGVSLALIHFMVDRVVNIKGQASKLILYAIVYFPAFIVIATYPRGFVDILNFAGSIVAILLGILPAYMIWRLAPEKVAHLPARIFMALTVLFFSFVIIRELFNVL